MILVDVDMPKNCYRCKLDWNRCPLQKSEFAVPKGRPDGCPIKAEITSDSLLKALISEVMTPEQIQEALIIDWLNSFNTDSAPKCFEAVQLLKAKVSKGEN